MKHLKKFKVFETQKGLTKIQINFLNRFVKGKWKINQDTGLVDIEGSFDCGRQGLTSLKGITFGKVTGNFYCHNNKLTSLEGAPQEVGKDFSCDYNQLTSLKGAPQKVGWNFYCDHNQLTSLEGAPQKVGETFYCDHNQLTSLEGAPGEVGRIFYCDHNPVTEESLKLIFSKMKEWNSYEKSLGMVMDKINEEDLKLLLSNAKEEELVDSIIELNSFKIFDWLKSNNTRLYDMVKSKMGNSLDLASDLGALGF